MDLEKEIQQAARLVKDPAGRQVRVLEDQEAVRLAAASGLSPAAVYETALAREIVPYRYLRNHECISVNDQLRLARSRVAVVGAGGLGGNVILLLARIGVGRIVVVDSDRFDETNLNRQALSSMETLGLPKAEVAARMVEGINPGVEVIAHTARLDPSNGISLLRGTQVVVDALDNVPSRFALQDAARDLNIPLVHGAIAGFEGQAMTIFPEDRGMNLLYGKNPRGEKSGRPTPEAMLGVPAITPALIAALQAMEVLKILLDRGRVLRKTMLHADLETGRIEEFSFG